ncbi:MAG: gamma-glutamylcyclotransferase, partial [Gammaproteobacteria bacterium]|nr:gamma-glutamylcyclotransferase [Gammaproteobacteria bacterium]
MPEPIERYFAFGSNMNPERVRARGLQATAIRGAVLAQVRLTFDKVSREHPGIGHAALTFAPGGSVEGVLYDLVGADDIARMDVFERTPIKLQSRS